METKIILTPTTHGVLSLGRQMEDDVRSITFDCNALVEEFGEGSATLVHQRSGDEAPYLVTITEGEENVYTWTLTNLDTAFCGIGKAEIRWTTADGLGKSVTFMTQTLPSITGDTVMPEALESWYDAMIQWITDHSITEEQLAQAVADYIEAHPVPVPVTSVNNMIGDVVITAASLGAYVAPSGGIPSTDMSSDVQNNLTKAGTALQASDLDDAIDTALEQAKASGEFDGNGISSAVLNADYTLTLTFTDGTSYTTPSIRGVQGPQGETGATGPKGDSGEGIPSGGAEGQVLVKKTGADYDAEWSDGLSDLKEDFLDIDERVTALEQGGGSGSGLSNDVKQALLQIASKVVYVDGDGQTYYNALYDALYPTVRYSVTNTLSGCATSNDAATAVSGSSYSATITANAGYSLTGATVSVTMDGIDITSTAYNNGVISIASVSGDIAITVTAVAITLTGINAAYTQSGTVYDTDTLDSLKADLVVTAVYSDSSTQTVPAADYALSGTLVVGTSTITVTYGGKTTTFNVTVTEAPSVLTGYTEVGSPTITDNILTVADGKFVKSNAEFSPGDSSWRITCKYRNTSGAYGRYTDILGSVDSSNASYRSILLESSSNFGGSISMYLSSNGASWDLGSGNNTQANDVPHGQGVWVWLDFSFDGSSYILKYSDDGETFTTGKIWANTGKVIGGYPVGFGVKRNGYLQGEIDLSECKIWIDGDLYWSAV